MNRICVWAPEARQVEVLSNGATVPMRSEAHGWWTAEIEGPNYSFQVNGTGPFPDPRSPWQPQGVHGPSRLVDHAAFPWTDSQWQAPPLSSAIVYELHVGTFTPEGTFESAIGRLAYLASLGITHVELMPVQEFSGNWGWGYDGVNLFAPHHAYGGPDGLKRLVNACHEYGLAVLLDVVYNHLGPVENYLNRFGPYFTSTYKTPWGPAVNLDDAGSDEVRRFFCDNALMWLRDYHFDGLRLDAVHAIHDSSAIHFLEQLSSEVAELEAQTGRTLILIAESDLNDPRVITPREAHGYGINAQWSDDFHHALHTALTGELSGYYADFGSLADLANALKHVFVYDGRYSRFRRRLHGRPVVGLSGSRFLGYLQNHDQVGNRAQGERSSALMSLGKLKIGAALVLCAPFLPMVFQGEEFAASSPFLYFTNHEDPAVGRAVSEGRRREFEAFGWDPTAIPDPQDPDVFLRSKLRWIEVEQSPHAEILTWYRKLIALRRSTPALTDGRLDRVSIRFDEEQQWIAMQRGPVHILCNVSCRRRIVPVPVFAPLLASAPYVYSEGSAVEMGAESVLIAHEKFS
jgi:maltooligosyltrehalose trehalohydrolase